MDDYLRDFVQESEENITELNNALLTLERDPDDPEAMDRVFRMAHTLKGNCGAMGFENASDLAHAVEDRLDDVRAGRIEADPELMDRIFEGVDQLEAMVDEVRDHGEPVSDPGETIQKLRAAGPESTLDTPTTDEIDDALAGIDRPSERTHNVYHVRLDVIQEDGVDNGTAVVKALEDAFDLLGTVPDRETVAASDFDGVLDAVFATAVTETAITAALDPVDAVDGAVISEVTDRVDLPEPDTGDDAAEAAGAAGAATFAEQADLDSERAQEMEVDDLLGEFDEYDDLDALVEEVDDVEGLDDMGDAGTFDDVKAQMGIDDAGDDTAAAAGDSTPAGGDAEFDDLFEDGEAAGDDTVDAEPADEAEADVEDATDTFQELKSEVEPVGFDELQTELEDLEFDEYSDEEEVGFEELLTEEEMEGDTFEAGREPTDEALDDILVNESVDDLDDEESTADASAGAAAADTADSPATAEATETTDSPGDAADADPAIADGTAAEADAFDDDAFGDDGAAFEEAVDSGSVERAEQAEADAATADQEAVDDAFDDDFGEVSFGDDDETAAADADVDSVDADADSAEADALAVEEPAVEPAPDESVELDEADEPATADEDPFAAEDDSPAETDTDQETVTADATTVDDEATGDDFGSVDEVDTGFDASDDLGTVSFGDEDADGDLSFDESEAATADSDAETVTADSDAETVTADSDSETITADSDAETVTADTDSETVTADSDAEAVTADAESDATVGEDVTADEVIESVDTSEFSVEEDESDVASLDSPAAADDLTAGTGADDLATGFDDGPAALDADATDAADAAGSALADARDDESIPDRDVDIEALLPTPPHEIETEEDGEEGTESVRVDVDQIDELMNLVEGLVTSRARLRRGVESGESMAVLDDELDDLEALTSELQDTVMDVRLVPIQTVTSRIPRVVRDISREQGKEVAFDIEGEDVEVDRSILDDIRDPLMHLVRNAVDHGIEPPEEREAAGKDPEGAVSLIARRSRDNVVIEVVDDGRGLDPDALKAAAVDEGVLTEAEAAEMDDESAYELIFHPGLSTTEEVTDVSGRGVGMDVVKSTVEELDGAVDVESSVGNGTTISLTLPVSLAIAEVLFVESGGEEYGIPLKAVEEVGRMGMVEDVDGEEMLVRGDEQFPLVRLSEALDTPEVGRNGDGMLVRVTDDDRSIAVHCDEVRGQQEVVVKPFEDLLGDIPGLSGATVLGEGEVVNILDVKTL